MMQAENLSEENVEELKKLFEKQKEKNPDLNYNIYDSRNPRSPFYIKKNCMFKDKCSKGK